MVTSAKDVPIINQFPIGPGPPLLQPAKMEAIRLLVFCFSCKILCFLLWFDWFFEEMGNKLFLNFVH